MPDFGYDPLRLPLAPPMVLAPRPGLLARALAILNLWRRRDAERNQLANFDDRALRDLAITRADATREVDKPFWRA